MLARQTTDDADDLDADVLTTEAFWLLDLSIEMGMPRDELLARMGSRAYTDYRARAIVSIAMQDILDEQAPARLRRRRNRGWSWDEMG